jgi:prepilin-type N-terminal cleavage/methylation domain-containing protein
MKKRNDGFTLVEILIAMVVLSVGMLGILALFPAGIKADQQTLQQTYVAQIGESVYNALLSSFRDATTSTRITFSHDFQNLNTGTIGKEDWNLPTPSGSYVWFPNSINGATNLDTLMTTTGPYRLGLDPNVKNTIDNMKALNDDATDPYERYGFVVGLKQSTVEPGLFDVVIRIYRQGGPGRDTSGNAQQANDSTGQRWTLVENGIIRGRIMGK